MAAKVWHGVISQSAQVKLNKSLLKNALRPGDEVDVISGARGLKIPSVRGGVEGRHSGLISNSLKSLKSKQSDESVHSLVLFKPVITCKGC